MKYGLDQVLARVLGQEWLWIDYWSFARLFPRADEQTYLFSLVMFLTSIPFAWIGVALTVQRIRDIGLPLWLVVVFFVPFLKLILFALLAVLPGQTLLSPPLPDRRKMRSLFERLIPRSRLGSGAAAMLVTGLLGLIIAFLAVNVFKNYGWGLFIALPFCLGLVAVLIFGYHHETTWASCFHLALLSVVVTGLSIVIVAVEGLICVLLAFPLALLLATLGALLGHEMLTVLRTKPAAPQLYGAIIFLVPLLISGEKLTLQPSPVYVVNSVIEIHAEPERVWNKLIVFPQIPPPKEWLFKVGIAYPISAHIRGTGPGAVRYCVFSTGTFVEPIERWEPGRVLRFSVTRNPPPLREWTPFGSLHATHLDGFFRARHGQFQLAPAAPGKTRLTGSTWYSHGLWPAAYWKFWTDLVIHRVHGRVLNHIKTFTEQPESGSVSR